MASISDRSKYLLFDNGGSVPVRGVVDFKNYKPVLWIRIGFNADPDPAFYLNVDLGSQNSAEPDHGLTFNSQKECL